MLDNKQKISYLNLIKKLRLWLSSFVVKINVRSRPADFSFIQKAYLRVKQNQRAGLDNPASPYYLMITMMILSTKTRMLKPLAKFGILLLSAFAGGWERL